VLITSWKRRRCQRHAIADFFVHTCCFACCLLRFRLTHWGEAMANTSAMSAATMVNAFLAANGSFNLYMAHGEPMFLCYCVVCFVLVKLPSSCWCSAFAGGTNWGFWNGANGGGTSFQPSITSYDYDAPISEGGGHGFGADGDKFAAIQVRVVRLA
jgi:hypothetical protein